MRRRRPDRAPGVSQQVRETVDAIRAIKGGRGILRRGAVSIGACPETRADCFSALGARDWCRRQMYRAAADAIEAAEREVGE